MSNINRWFKTAMSSDFSFRQSQNRPLFFTGPNRSSIGRNSRKKDDENAPKRFVAGKSLAGSDEVAG
jgi:hypothetical protein